MANDHPAISELTTKNRMVIDKIISYRKYYNK